jgi:hypothetical protein
MGDEDNGGIAFIRTYASADGETRRFGPGSVFLAEDTTGKGHQTRAVGVGGCVVVWVACR